MIFNPYAQATALTLPEGQWTIYIDGENAGITPLGSAEGSVSVEPISAMVPVKAPGTEESKDVIAHVNPPAGQAGG